MNAKPAMVSSLICLLACILFLTVGFGDKANHTVVTVIASAFGLFGILLAVVAGRILGRGTPLDADLLKSFPDGHIFVLYSFVRSDKGNQRLAIMSDLPLPLMNEDRTPKLLWDLTSVLLPPMPNGLNGRLMQLVFTKETDGSTGMKMHFFPEHLAESPQLG
ncbi:MAG: hypothetical protein AAB455_02040 [Patescibacteria group bacterium]